MQWLRKLGFREIHFRMLFHKPVWRYVRRTTILHIITIDSEYKITLTTSPCQLNERLFPHLAIERIVKTEITYHSLHLTMPLQWCSVVTKLMTYFLSMSCFFCSSEVGSPIWERRKTIVKTVECLLYNNAYLFLSLVIHHLLHHAPCLAI